MEKDPTGSRGRCGSVSSTSSRSEDEGEAGEGGRRAGEEGGGEEEEGNGAEQEGGAQRMALPASPTPLPKKANTPLNRFGFPATVEFRGSEDEEAECLRKEAKREPEWKMFLASWPDHEWKTKTLRRMVLKGIPNSVRGNAWQCLTRSAELRAAHPPDTYQLLLRKDSLFKEQIGKDVQRLWPQHVLYRDRDGPGQQSLRNVLLAFSVYNPSVGYTGGMGTLPGILLMYMPEEEAFWTFVRLCVDYNLEQIFAYADTMGVKRSFYILERLLPIFLPELSHHLEREGLDIRLFATRWLLTNFALGLPFNIVVRFLDIFMVDGYDSTLVMCIAILSLLSDFLLAQNFDTMVLFFNNKLEKGDALDVRKLFKRYAKLSTRVRCKVHSFSRQWRARMEREGTDSSQANKLARLVA